MFDVDRLAAKLAERLAVRLDTRPLYSPKTLAERLAVSERTVRDMLRGPDPDLPSFVILVNGRTRLRRVTAAAADRYIAARQAAEEA